MTDIEKLIFYSNSILASKVVIEERIKRITNLKNINSSKVFDVCIKISSTEMENKKHKSYKLDLPILVGDRCIYEKLLNGIQKLYEDELKQINQILEKVGGMGNE